MGRQTDTVTVIGAGLAGSEAAWQLASRGLPVRLIEMRPHRLTPAHRTGDFGELVCSNSFRSDDEATAAGVLKRELALLGSVVLEVARETAVPAGAALAVDRRAFSQRLTERLGAHPLVSVVREEATSIPDGDVIVAAGPLASDALQDALSALVGSERLAFFDAASPIVEGATIDMRQAFSASRWGKGSGSDYLNCPLTAEEYRAFVEALVTAERVQPRDFERRELFSACQPIEEVARTGADALRYGALKPTGLVDPHTGRRPYAVVQLRPENRMRTAYNLVGFQTNLTFPAQDRVFRLVPALREAAFVRYGVMHRNTFIDAPRLLSPALALHASPRVRFAGQIAGTEGYLEAAATGLLAALNVWAARGGLPPIVLPPTTVLGALVAYATDPETVDYQPMHVNFGLVPPLDPPVRGKRARYAAYAARALRDLASYLASRPELAVQQTPAPQRTAPTAEGQA